MAKKLHPVEMELSETMAAQLKELFNVEVEMLQGTIEKLPDGRSRYKFEVNDEKGEIIKQFMIRAMFQNPSLN